MGPLRVDFMDELRRLRVLREFRERGSIAATAEALHLTPSAVSQQLARIARDVGFDVLRPVGRRVVLTPRGQALLAHADTVFAAIERARHELDSWDDSVRGTITIGAFSTAIAGLLPALLDRARHDLPDVRIMVCEAESPALFDGLDAGRFDVALALHFTGSPTAGDPRYHCVDLGPDELDLALPANHPLCGAQSLTLKDVEGEPWITGNAAGCLGAITAMACTAAGFTPNVAHRTDDWQALAQLVAHGHGVALIPRLAQRNLPAGVTIRELTAPRPQRHIFAAVLDGAQHSPLVVTILGLLTAGRSPRGRPAPR
ncbi:LysR family transcriptional regulator [Virgisporangium aurantiacum]|uniref:LysR family transcriptional regulator n=1 Tax=Virgisporangium aurantiacum TaxID=175570 RepID=A0A8J3Z8C2_9ACTN|nr:LysR family transcriptional regulator [Virgisporangium aurantiacum]GIJ57081.1 LysR family transcriptional regulator [Virgisporangium aurantiacum]